MDIDEAKEGEVVILGPSEGLNTQTSPKFEKKLNSLLDAKVRLVVVDMRKVDYLSSAALRVLLMITRRLLRGHGRLVLCGLRDEVRKVFSISGFDKDLTIVPTRAEAVALAAATPAPPAKEEAKKEPRKEAAPPHPFAVPSNPFAAPAPAPPPAEPARRLPSARAVQALRLLAAGEGGDAPWSRWPEAKAPDAVVKRVLERLA